MLPGSPSDLAGVAAGDQVLEAGGIPLDAERRDQVLAVLDGAPGTSLEIGCGDRDSASWALP